MAFDTATESKNLVIRELASLEIGDGLLVEDYEWTLTTPLREYIYQYGRKGRSNGLAGKSFKTTKTRTGWQVIRTAHGR